MYEFAIAIAGFGAASRERFGDLRLDVGGDRVDGVEERVGLDVTGEDVGDVDAFELGGQVVDGDGDVADLTGGGLGGVPELEHR